MHCVLLSRGGCSHGRVNDYYVESVLSLVEGKQFLSWLCPTWEDFVAGSCCDSSTAVMGAGITRLDELCLFNSKLCLLKLQRFITVISVNYVLRKKIHTGIPTNMRF